METGKKHKYCSFINCVNSAPSKNYSFHRYPKDEKRSLAWVKASGNKKLFNIPAVTLNKSYVVCSVHFDDWCFVNSEKKQLVHDAIPNSKKCLVFKHSVFSKMGTSNTAVVNNQSGSLGLLVSSPVSGQGPSSLSAKVSILDSNNTFSNILAPVTTNSSTQLSLLSSRKYTPIKSKLTQLCEFDTLTDTISSSSSKHFGLSTSSVPTEEQSDISELVSSTNVSRVGGSSMLVKACASLTTNCSTPKSYYCTKKYTPTKSKLAHKVKKYRDMVRKLKLKSIHCNRKKHPTAQSVNKTLSSRCVSEELANFISRQVELGSKQAKSRRYTEFEKIQAYRIFSRSRAAYCVLRDMLQLPTERTLQRFISSKLTYTGISTDIISALKKVLDGKEKCKKMFALIFDEISLKPSLVYDKCKDHVVGFEDFSCRSYSNYVANQALVLMLRSLTSKTKLPLGFYFSRYSMTSNKLKNIIINALEELFNAGAIVKVLICDQGGNNSKLFTMLGVNAYKPFFKFHDNKVYCLFDPPHLLKSLRRNLMKYDIQTDKGLVSFKHIKDFYKVDQTLLIRSAPKLTDAHISAIGLNSMKVGLAAQLFSHTVAAGMDLCISSNFIDTSAGPTVEFVQRINYLFDSVNGTMKYPLRGKQFHCAVKKDSVHWEFWKEMLLHIDSWVFVQPGASISISRSHNQRPQSKKGWKLTIASLLQLSEEMLVDHSYFMTKRCNQDCLENFFSCVRGSGGNRTNPSAYEFSQAFKLSSVSCFGKKNKFSNCEPDGDKFMFYILTPGSQTVKGDMISERLHSANDSNCLDSDDEQLQETSFEATDILSKNVIAFLSGYISRKVLRTVPVECSVCQTLLVDKTKPLLPHTMFLHFKEYKGENSEGGLAHPTENVTRSIAALLEIAKTFFSSHLPYPNITKNLKTLFEQSPMLNFINCELHGNDVKEKIMAFSVKLFLKIHLRERNREIKSASK